MAKQSVIKAIKERAGQKLTDKTPYGVDKFNKAFWSLGPKDKSLYLWLEDFDFLIILKDWKSNKNRKTRIVVTSYSVDVSYRRVLRKRYKNAYKVL